MKTCENCREPLKILARQHARFCSPRCRAAANRKAAPAEMRKLPRWVRHVSKRPIRLNGSPASSTDPKSWSTYAQVRAFSSKGFVLNGDGIVCLDLDHCIEDGEVVGRAAEILARLPETYVEVSVSGTGLHVFGYGSVPHGRKLPGGVEVYGTGRFIAMTGNRYSSTSRLADLTPIINDLL